MLTLTRKEGQTIAIENNISEGRIEVKVLDLGGGKVRLGIDAPDSVKILRGELIEDAGDESQAARRTRAGEGLPSLTSRDAQAAGLAGEGLPAARR